MQLTKEQWLSKLKSFVPPWFSESQGNQAAIFAGIAAALAASQEAAKAHFDQTFILSASEETLDLHGFERNFFRSVNETDDFFRQRIRTIVNTVAKSELQSVVDQCLHNGPAILIENRLYGFFDDADNEYFFDTDETIWIDRTKSMNWFTVVVPPQTGGVSSDIQTAIVSALEEKKARGISYDILYRT